MFVGEVKNKIKMVYRFCENNSYKSIKIILKNGSKIYIEIGAGLIYSFTKNKEIEFKTVKKDLVFLTLNCLDIQDIEKGDY